MKHTNPGPIVLIHLLVIPPTSFVTSLLLGKLTFSIAVMLLTTAASAVGVLLGTLFYSMVLRRLVGLKLYWLYGFTLTVCAQLALILFPFLLNQTLANLANDYSLVIALAFMVSAILHMSDAGLRNASKKTSQ